MTSDNVVRSLTYLKRFVVAVDLMNDGRAKIKTTDAILVQNAKQKSLGMLLCATGFFENHTGHFSPETSVALLGQKLVGFTPAVFSIISFD